MTHFLCVLPPFAEQANAQFLAYPMAGPGGQIAVVKRPSFAPAETPKQVQCVLPLARVCVRDQHTLRLHRRRHNR